MQRLVYSPRAWVFIKRRNGNIADVSKYITAGSVNRRVGAVSTANITLRNPNMLFTAQGGRHAAFAPMDPITIYLQRLKDRPVRVFTGFLDDTPYYELYPGTIDIKASCTLKKLLYKYFDPALPYTQTFLAKYGWMPTGNGFENLGALTGQEKDKDGGMGRLLFATLRDIGEWREKNIKIERLPNDLIARMTDLFRTFREDNEAARQELEDLITQFVGASDYGGSGASGGTGTDPSTGMVRGTDHIVATMTKIAKQYNIPPEMVVATWLIEWPSLKDSAGNPHWGWFQWDTKSGPAGSYSGWGVTKSKPNGCYDLGFATDSYCDAASRAAARIPSLRNNTLEWTEKVQGVNQGSLNNPLYPNTWSAQIEKARGLIAKYGNAAANDPAPGIKTIDSAGGPAVEQASRSGGGLPKLTTDAPKALDQKVHAVIAGGTTSISSPFGEPNHHGHTHMGIDVPCPSGTACVAPADGKIGRFAQTTGFGEAGGMIHFVFTEDTGDIKAGTVLGWGHVSTVYKRPGESVKGGEMIARSNYPAPHVHFIMRNDDNDMDGTVDPTPVFQALQKGLTAPTSGGNVTNPTDPTSTDTQLSEINSRITATFLAGNLNWSSMEDTIEAIGLQGNKSLMNDKPLMPFIQQMTDASLRQFQSMPNGDFFGFYPDYFGETFHRPPYWYINDIEILDGRVRLSDEALVTHEYVLGDTMLFGVDSFANKLISTGVVSLINAFVSDRVTTNADKKAKNDPGNAKFYHAFNRVLKQDEAVQFLVRYGARPNVEEFPMIRHPFFELFMAYQRFMQAWARQFLTPFRFTFMPELYPGGKLGIPEHGLQMYIEEVTHSWDYESGFVTEADLSAPAVLFDKKGRPMSNNLPPNMPTALLEIAGGAP
jgi:murein DD-endopeptidase MepM/ murein hydrolase activator NlpD